MASVHCSHAHWNGSIAQVGDQAVRQGSSPREASSMWVPCWFVTGTARAGLRQTNTVP